MQRKVIRLEIQPEYDFALIAMVCSLRDFKLCFELNDSAGLRLKRAEDIEVTDRDRNRSRHVHYCCRDEDNREFRVIGNRGHIGYFIPEKKNIHYFLLIRNAEPAFIKSFYIRLRGMSWLEGAYELDPAALKSAEHFLLLE